MCGQLTQFWSTHGMYSEKRHCLEINYCGSGGAKSDAGGSGMRTHVDKSTTV